MAALKKPHVHPVDEAWLALGAEAPIAPDLPIVDSHIHLWDFSDPPYFIASYEGDARAAGISAAIYVDCTMAYREEGPDDLACVGEVEFAAAQAAQGTGSVDFCAAIIGWADLCLGDGVDVVLDELERAGNGRFRGVRCRATYDADPLAGYGGTGAPEGLMQREDFRRGVARLQAKGHVLDLYAFHTQLNEVADLARAFPDLPIVLNHIGGPLGIGCYADQAEQVFADWQAGMTLLSSCPNVRVKIGGVAISRIAIVKAEGRAVPPSSQDLAELCRPWVDHCLTTFGAQRCLFGSNFPVDKVAFPMLTFVNAMKRLTAHLPLSDQQAFFADNARRIYNI